MSYIYSNLFYYVEFVCIPLAVATLVQARDVLKVFEFFVLIRVNVRDIVIGVQFIHIYYNTI